MFEWKNFWQKNWVLVKGKIPVQEMRSFKATILEWKMFERKNSSGRVLEIFGRHDSSGRGRDLLKGTIL
jgi:hypothetical protein